LLAKQQNGEPFIDTESTIKLYDELVKSAEDRKMLEKELPAFVAARDKAVVELRREKLQKETSEGTNLVVKVQR
jgi:hypothetical protein